MNMDILEVQTELRHVTVPLWSDIRGQSYPATGVVLAARPLGGGEVVPFIVTAGNVVAGAERLIVAFSHFGRNQRSEVRRQAEIPGDALIDFIDPSTELAAIPAAAILSQLSVIGKAVAIRSISEELLPDDRSWRAFGSFERVTVIGHPEFIPFQLPRVPVAQTGITATGLAQDYNDRPDFLVDIGAVPGAIGSAVFLQRSIAGRSRFTFCGIVLEHLHTIGIGASYFSRVVKSTAVFELLSRRSALHSISPGA